MIRTLPSCSDSFTSTRRSCLKPAMSGAILSSQRMPSRNAVREGTPASLKAELRERDGLDRDPTLDDVFLDATGRSRSRVAGDVQEVTA